MGLRMSVCNGKENQKKKNEEALRCIRDELRDKVDPRTKVTFKVSAVSAERTVPVKTGFLAWSDSIMPDAEAHSPVEEGIHLTHDPNECPHPGIGALVMAFDKHLPLSLTPDFFWLLITQGLSQHVEANSEALRNKFVKHDGKKTLEIRRDDFVLGNPVNDWGGVVKDFHEQIQANTGEGVTDRMRAIFSTTTETDIIVSAATTMSAVKKYFDFKMYTLCGFPQITLEGSIHDYITLYDKIEELLSTLCLPDFAEKWGEALRSVMDRILATYKDPEEGCNAYKRFWESMCKIDGIEGSGAYDFVSGWINVFLPYTRNGMLNAFCRPYSDDENYDHRSIDVNDIPIGVVSVPVIWDYYGRGDFSCC